METKDAVTGAAIAVLLAILGLVIIIGLILLMMWKQPGIEHSPSQASSLSVPGTASLLDRESQVVYKAQVTQCNEIPGSKA